jgi:3-oxoacyl-[acyl-carrier-protein] synthase-3
MSGKEVYRHAVSAMNQSAARCLILADRSAKELTWIVPHQANFRIIEAVANRLEMPLEKFIINLDRYGNTSAACMPIALDEAVRGGKIHAGDHILLLGQRSFGVVAVWH